ncbi:transposase [Candidatus Roizmanbacteria bacterium]|nr:transposase [Candidatus Roizmanbacteria bacterium]
MRRDYKFVLGGIYHVCNKSIANFGIFKDPTNAQRFIKTLQHYNAKLHPGRYSYALRNKVDEDLRILTSNSSSLLKFLAYCIMPDHYHILVRILQDDCLSKYINDVENSFTRFFNIKFIRKGPLWQSRFRSVRIKTNEQLLHVTRYIHLNPTTDGLVDSPEDWKLSSYRGYVEAEEILNNLTEISIKNPVRYKKFVENQKDYQRRLKKIKKLLLE